MANPEDMNNGANNGANNGEGTTGKEMVPVKQKGGLGLALKIGGGLLFGCAFTGLGWLLRGLLGGDDDDIVAETGSDHSEAADE